LIRLRLCSGSTEVSEYQFARAYPAWVTPRTANQIPLGDGRLVDADMHLEYPNIVSENPVLDFDDWP